MDNKIDKLLDKIKDNTPILIEQLVSTPAYKRAVPVKKSVAVGMLALDYPMGDVLEFLKEDR